jgi:hypothetical protein
VKLQIVKGTVNQILTIFIQDSSSSTGAGLTGLVFNSAGLTCYYVRPGSAAAALTLATQTVTGAHSDGGFVEIDATNMPGWYRLDPSDAIIAAGVDSVGIHLKGATNMAPLPLEIQLTDFDLNDGVRGGLTALPNAAADAAGGLPISDAGGLDLDAKIGALTFTVANEVDSNVITKTGFSLAATGLDAITSTATGMVEIAKAVWNRILSGATHNIAASAGRRLRGLQENGAVYNGEVHVDTNNGTAGTIPYENGTSDNPVLTWADAIAIAPNVNGGLSDYHIINGSSITFTSSMDNKSMFGDNWTLALGGQSCADIYVEGAGVSGIGTAATGEMHFEGCNFGISSIQSGHFDFCAFADTITATLTGGYQYHNCYSGVAGAGAPIFTKTAGQTITSEWRNWAGSITVSTIESGDVMTIGGTLGTVTLNGSDGSVEIRGSYKNIVDNRTGSPTLNLDGAIQSDYLVDLFWDESAAGHTVAGSFGKIIKNFTDIVQLDGTVTDAGPLVTDFD